MNVQAELVGVKRCGESREYCRAGVIQSCELVPDSRVVLNCHHLSTSGSDFTQALGDREVATNATKQFEAVKEILSG
jgi:hypothetical protein